MGSQILRNAKIGKMFRSFLFALLFSIEVVAPQSTHAGTGYPELSLRITHEIVEILIKNGVPARHDRNIPWAGISAVPGKYTINFYQTDEIPLAAQMETIEFFMNLYEERDRKERFRLKMYRETKEERRGWFSGVEPFFEMTIGGDN